MKRLYSWLVRIYPAGFREEYGKELERQFRDEYRQARTGPERARVGLRAIVDVLASAPGELFRELLQDLRFAVRIHRRRVLPAAFTLIVLALAIGATTGTFSVLNALLFRPLPFAEPDRLVEFGVIPVRSGDYPDVKSWMEGQLYLENLALSSSKAANVLVGGRSFRANLSETSADFFRVLGVRPIRGWDFLSEEDAAGSRVAVIGHGLWQGAFGGSAEAIGATIRLSDVPFTIIGVAPPEFDFPAHTEIWVPTFFGMILSRNHEYGRIGRLRAGWTFEQAAGMYAAEVAREYTASEPGGFRPRMERLQEKLAGPVHRASFVLLGMMAFVLLIACANLAHLLLSRASERRQELAVRRALGASRARLTRQMMTESILLTGAAAMAGLLVARWTAGLAASASPAPLAAQSFAVLDWRVLGFVLGLVLITGLVFGILPASLIGKAQGTVRGRGGSKGLATGRFRTTLMAGQVALTVMLVAGAFNMGRSFLNLMGADLGFETDQVLTLNVDFQRTRDVSANFTGQALDRLRQLPGVESAGATAYLPLKEYSMFEGMIYRVDPEEPQASSRSMSVSPGYFTAIGTPLLEGREFTEDDRAGSELVVIVNQTLAERYPGETLVGRRIYLNSGGTREATIVGVVGAQHFAGPEAEAWDLIYRPIEQYEQWAATFVVRVDGNAEDYIALTRDAITSVDPRFPVYDVQTLDQRLADTLAAPRFYTSVIVFLGAFALVVAAVGAYGMARHSVSQREREIGIRVALGGTPTRVRAMVARQNLMPVLVGGVAGVTMAINLGRFLEYLLASAESTGVAVAGAAALIIAAATACPVWAATRRVVESDPTEALRVE